MKSSSKAPTEVTGLGAVLELCRRLAPSFRRRSLAGGALEHLASLPLTAQSSLALIRLHKETLLLGITPQSITVLTKGQADEMDGADPRQATAAPEAQPPRLEEGFSR